jgi:hypothetical protein
LQLLGQLNKQLPETRENPSSHKLQEVELQVKQFCEHDEQNVPVMKNPDLQIKQLLFESHLKQEFSHCFKHLPDLNSKPVRHEEHQDKESHAAQPTGQGEQLVPEI